MAIETYESLQQKIDTLKAAIATETIKINRLSKFTNYLQLRVWREHRRRMNFRLAYLIDRQKLYKNETHPHERPKKSPSS